MTLPPWLLPFSAIEVRLAVRYRGALHGCMGPRLSRQDPGRFHGKALRTPSFGRFLPLAQALEVSRDQLFGDMRPLRPRWIGVVRPFDLEFQLIFSCGDTMLQNALYCVLRTFRDFFKFPGRRDCYWRVCWARCPCDAVTRNTFRMTTSVDCEGTFVSRDDAERTCGGRAEL